MKPVNNRTPRVSLFPKVFLSILAIFLCAGIFVFIFNRQSLKHVTVQLKWEHNAQFAGMYIAQNNDLYKNEGLSVNLKERDFAQNTIAEDVNTGKVDFGIIDMTQFLQEIAEGKKIKAIGVIYQISPAALISLKEKNITSPGDLKGKRIGIINNDKPTRLLYKFMLAKFGMSEYDVTFIETKNHQIDALLNNTVDIVSSYRTNEDYSLTTRELPHRLLLPENYGLSMYDDVIITSDKMISQHPDVVRKFLGATIAGWEYALSHEDEAVAATRSVTHSDNFDEYLERYILATSKPLIKPSETSRIGAMDPKVWQQTVNALYAAGVIAEPLQPGSVFTSAFLP